jgi:hypothetical protein
MKKIIPIIAMLLVVVFASGCTTQPQTYNSNGVSFQYPGDWNTNYKSDIQQSFGSSANVLVSLGKGDSGMAVAKVNASGINISTEELISAFKSSLQSSGFQTVSEKTRTVDGVSANEVVLKDNSTGLYGSFTIFKKNNDIYLIMIATPDNNQQTVDMVLNSFKIQ